MKNWSRVILLALAALSVNCIAFTPSAVQAKDCWCPGYIRECRCTNRVASANTAEMGACCTHKQVQQSVVATDGSLSGLGISGKPGEFLDAEALHATSKALAEPNVSLNLQQRPPQQDNRNEESTFYTYQVDRYQFSVRTQSGAVTMQGVNLINNRAELSFQVPTNGDRRADEYHDFVVVRSGDRIPAAVRDSWSVGFFTYQNQTWRIVEYVYRDDRQRR